MTMAMFEALNTRLRNIFRSITGTAARLVLTTKATAAATAATQLPMILADPHPQEDPLSKPREMAPMVTTIMRLPSRSGMRVVRSWRTLGIIFQVTRTAAMPMGRLMTKIHLQLSAVSNPPTTGPMEPAAAPLTAHTRTPRLTRSGGSVVRTRPRLAGMIIAAPAACTHRNPTRTHKSGLTAQARLATVKTASPRMKVALRPYLSAKRPAGMRSAPKNRA